MKSGVLNINDIPTVINMVSRPTFAMLCTYLVMLNDRDREKNKGLDPRDAYDNAMRDLIKTLKHLVTAYRKIEKERS